jgi:hypothetical protein
VVAKTFDMCVRFLGRRHRIKKEGKEPIDMWVVVLFSIAVLAIRLLGFLKSKTTFGL